MDEIQLDYLVYVLKNTTNITQWFNAWGKLTKDRAFLYKALGAFNLGELVANVCNGQDTRWTKSEVNDELVRASKQKHVVRV